MLKYLRSYYYTKKYKHQMTPSHKKDIFKLGVDGVRTYVLLNKHNNKLQSIPYTKQDYKITDMIKKGINIASNDDCHFYHMVYTNIRDCNIIVYVDSRFTKLILVDLDSWSYNMRYLEHHAHCLCNVLSLNEAMKYVAESARMMTGVYISRLGDEKNKE